MKIQPPFAVMMVAVLTGCASDPVPEAQMKLTEQALQQAAAVGVADTQPDMALARSRFQQARVAIDNHDYKPARQLAEQAELDARLAEARELTSKSDAQVEQLNVRIERLHRQLETTP